MPARPNGANVVKKSIISAWTEASYWSSEFWVRFASTTASIKDLAGAIADAQIATTRRGGDSRVTARDVRDSPTGPIALVTGLDGRAQLLEWLDDLETQLSARGLVGTLGKAGTNSLPSWMTAVPSVPTAFIAWSYGAGTYETNPRQARPVWRPDEPATRTIAAQALNFVAVGGPSVLYQTDATNIAMSTSSGIDELFTTSLLAGSRQVGVLCSDDSLRQARIATLTGSAQSVLQIIHAEETGSTRRDDVVELAAAISAHPDLVDHAFIRPAPRLANSFYSVSWKGHGPEHVSELEFRRSQHLTTTHLIDAHGIQVVTDQQLAAIKDLDHWDVRPLGHGRHLVSAHDLHEWYGVDLDPWYRKHGNSAFIDSNEPAPPVPEPLQQARADFSDILLTADTRHQHRPPWATVTNPT